VLVPVGRDRALAKARRESDHPVNRGDRSIESPFINKIEKQSKKKAPCRRTHPRRPEGRLGAALVVLNARPLQSKVRSLEYENTKRISLADTTHLMPAADIVIKGAREHNLRDVNLVLP